MLNVKWIEKKYKPVQTKIVNYHGFGVEVPLWTKYICFDYASKEDTLVLLAFEEEPELNEDMWEIRGESKFQSLDYYIEFEGDYRESLMKVSE